MAAVTRIDRERLSRLMAARDGRIAPELEEVPGGVDTPPGEPKWWYWQGRIDEFCAQNAIGSGELAELLMELRP